MLEEERKRHGDLDPTKQFRPKWRVTEADSLELDVPEGGGTLGLEMLAGTRLPSDIPSRTLKNVVASACHAHMIAGYRLVELSEMYIRQEQQNEHLISQLGKEDAGMHEKLKKMKEDCEVHLNLQHSNMLMNALKGKLLPITDEGSRQFDLCIQKLEEGLKKMAEACETEKLALQTLKSDNANLGKKAARLANEKAVWAQEKAKLEEEKASIAEELRKIKDELTAKDMELSEAKKNTAESFINSLTFKDLLLSRWEGGVAASKRGIYHTLAVREKKDMDDFDKALENDMNKPFPWEELPCSEDDVLNVDPSCLIDELLKGLGAPSS